MKKILLVALVVGLLIVGAATFVISDHFVNAPTEKMNPDFGTTLLDGGLPICCGSGGGGG